MKTESKTESNKTREYMVYDAGGSEEEITAPSHNNAKRQARAILRDWWANQLDPGERVYATLAVLGDDGYLAPEDFSVTVSVEI